MNGQEKILLPASDQSKIYGGDCYIFQYSYPGEDKEEHLIGTWFGKQSVEVIICQESYLSWHHAHSKDHLKQSKAIIVSLGRGTF